MSTRATKTKILELFKGRDLGQIQASLAAISAKDTANALFSLICRDDPSLRWPAISCMGTTLARLADQDLEEARIMMRRFLWSLNDESGGIGWGAPESMAEALCCHEILAEEYAHMLISYMREDGDEAHQDGNYIEHPLLQRGLLWGVARLSGCRPELLRRKGAEADILPYLRSRDAETRGLAALACNRLHIKAARNVLTGLLGDTNTFQLYDEKGGLTQVRVGDLAKEALDAMGGTMRDGLFPAVACLQFSIAPGEVERNIDQVRAMLAAKPPAPGTLVLLPEIWATGFDYPRTLELGRMTTEILRAMQDLARAGQIFLAGSLTDPQKGHDRPRNSLFMVGAEGLIGTLPKQHLFRYWQEDQYYQGGPAAPPMNTPHGPLGGLICYDLRFPEVAKRQAFAGCRLLVVAAQWPLSRLDHWQTLVRARAIENQCYVAACNGCGVTGSMELAGHSMIVAPDGQVLQQAGPGATLIAAPLDPAFVDEQRRRFFPAGDRPWLCADAQKIVRDDQLLAELSLIRRHGSRVAFTNGCFDILHAGHVSYLEQARRTADCLVVGLNTDASVKGLKGSGRPVNKETDRARVLAALGCVDYVILFDEATPLRLITAIQPDVLVKGADYEEQHIVGAAEVKSAGGQVQRIVFEHDCSTSALIQRIQNGGLPMATLRIDGMKCQHCAKTAKKALEDLGATEVEINLDRGEASYQGSLDTEAVRKAMADKGYTLVN